MSTQLGTRLRQIRRDRDQSLRDFSSWLREETGFSVSHESIRLYEEGERVVPSGYLRALCRATRISADWLLLGNGLPDAKGLDFDESSSPGVPAGDADGSRQSWDDFLRQPRVGLRDVVIVESGVDAAALDSGSDDFSVVRLDGTELAERVHQNGDLLSTATEHLRWASAVVLDVTHVVYVADSDGVILWSTGTDHETARIWKVEPGVNWSNGTVDANGAATALETGKVVLAVGANIPPADKTFVGLAAPVVESPERVAGIVGLCASMEHLSPQQALVPAYVASMVERDLSQDRAG